MTLFSFPRNGEFFRGGDSVRKAKARVRSRNGGGGLRTSVLRRARVSPNARVEFLEERTLLSALVTTDQTDYAPGSTAIITATNDGNPGTNFQPGETVQFYIDRTDGIPVDAPPAIQTWDVTDGVGGFTPYQDASGMWWFPDTDNTVDGNVGTSWYVDPQFAGASLELTATGLTSGAVATTDYTDANLGLGAIPAQSGSVTYGTGGSVTYALSVTGNESGWSLSTGSLPSGVTAGFNHSTGSGADSSVVLTLTTSNSTAANLAGFSFSVTV
jgi:hypothetical protein